METFGAALDKWQSIYNVISTAVHYNGENAWAAGSL